MKALRGLIPVVLLIGLGFVIVGSKPRSSHAGTAILSPPPQPSPPARTYEIFCGLWRADGAFDSTLRIRNELLVAPLDVTPILFMADGTEYDLPSVHLATGGVAVVDINQALASAPASLAAHLSQFGSAELQWQYTSAGHIQASVQMLNVPQSLIFVTPFNGVDDTKTGQHTVEGLWWRRDPDVGGYVSLANVTDNSITATLQAIGSGGTTLPAGTFTLAAHSTQMLDLDELIGGLPGTENQAGGIRVEYNGRMDGLMATGGLVNAEEGYSATLLLGFHDASTAKAQAITYASAGLRAGAPDPAAGFPGGTTFQPYFVLRNTTTNPLPVSLALNWMTAQGAPASANLPALTLAPLATEQYDMKTAMAKLGLKDFSGSMNLSASLTGRAGDLLVATGAVDNTGTYVFEVEPQGVGPSDSKQVAYWTVANGFDTTYSLWNTTGEAEDLTVTFYYGDGSGSYALPVHLAAKASTIVDVKALIASGQPDAKGRVFPVTETQGSAIIRNTVAGTIKTADGATLPAPITLVAAGGTFSVQTATCGTTCMTCCGFSGQTVMPSNFSCPVGGSVQCSFSMTDCNGGTSGFSALWTSSDTTVMTVNSSGVATGVAPGSCTIVAQSSGSVVVNTGQICSGTGSVSCQQGNPGAGTTAKVDSLVFTISGNPVPNDPNGVIAKTAFILKIQAKSPTGVVPDTSFNAQNVPFTLTNMNTTVGEAVSSSTVNFTSGETDPP